MRFRHCMVILATSNKARLVLRMQLLLPRPSNVRDVEVEHNEPLFEIILAMPYYNDNVSLGYSFNEESVQPLMLTRLGRGHSLHSYTRSGPQPSIITRP